MAVFSLQRNAAVPHYLPGSGWVPGMCKLLGRKGIQSYPSEAYQRHCPMTADDLQVPCLQGQAKSFPHVSLLAAALVLNLPLTAYFSILIPVFTVNLQDHFPTDPGSFSINSYSPSQLCCCLTPDHITPIPRVLQPSKAAFPLAPPKWTIPQPSDFPQCISWTWN